MSGFDPVCVWSACSGCTPAVRAGDATAARLWVEQMLAEPHVAQRLRGVLSGLPEAAEPLRRDATALADVAAAALVSGRLKACGASAVLRFAPVAAAAASAAAPPPPAAARRAAPAAASSAPEGTFAAGVDVASMVQSLQQAARDGVPFCEVCEREGRA